MLALLRFLIHLPGTLAGVVNVLGEATTRNQYPTALQIPAAVPA
jgi:hypothetical protein